MRKITTNFNRLPAVLTPDECAILLNVDVRTVRRYCADGAIPAFKVGKKLWRINKESLKAFMEGNT